MLAPYEVVVILLGLAMSHVTIAQQERAVEGYPGVVQRDITLWSDGTRLSGILLYPKDRNEGERLPAIVLCNGWGGTKAFLMRSGIAPRFAAAGYVVINYDYRGWGDSDSRLVVRDDMPSPDKDGYVTVKAQAIRDLVDPVDQQQDVDAAISYVYGEPMVDRSRIGIWGTSFGGGHVIYRAAYDRRIACVVAQVGSMPDDWTKRNPDRLSDIYRHKSDRARGLSDPVPQGGGSPGVLKGTPYSERIALFNPGQYADRVRVPILLIDAEKEHYFKIEENSGRVHEILKKNGVPTEYHVLKGREHYDVYSGQCLDDVMKLETAWFDRYLKAEKDASRAQAELEEQNKAIVTTPIDRKSTKIRRVVTGHTPDGKAIVASNTKVDGVTVDSLPGAEFHKLWGANEAPTFPDDGSPQPARLWFPPVGGFRFAMFTMAPLSTALEEDIDWETVRQELEEKLPGVVSQANGEPDNPGMHTTDTIDFEYVVSGEVWLELDDGVEVHLKAGDTVVQNGSRHAWRNKGSEPCRMVVVLVGAHRS
jgi:dienelactone hydrolase/mannose-6-phosphate isomerase-like protein (cupin superfamily)